MTTYRPHLQKMLAFALVEGTVLFLIDQFEVVLSGEATAGPEV